MKCVICKHGHTQSGHTTVTLERNDTMLVFKHVPSQVCDNCGERYVDEWVTEKLLTAAEKAVKTGVQVDIRKYIDNSAGNLGVHT